MGETTFVDFLFGYICCVISVTVATYKTTGGKRNYVKADYCLFCCQKYDSKISKHYMSVHSDQIGDILMMPVGSKKRKLALQKLQNEGNFQHNVKVYNETLSVYCGFMFWG